MLKKSKLSNQIIGLYLIMTLLMMGAGLLGLAGIGRLHTKLQRVDRESIPLIAAVTDITQQQLEQSLRFGEVLLYARNGNRSSLELANEGFVNAGKRAVQSILEGSNIAQRWLERVGPGGREGKLEKIKTALRGVEKVHGDIEHLQASLIREIYQYDFLVMGALSQEATPAELKQAQAAHQEVLESTLSRLDDETKRLEDNLQKAILLTKNLGKSSSQEIGQWYEITTKGLVTLMIVTLVGGGAFCWAVLAVHTSRRAVSASSIRNALDTLGSSLDPIHGSGQHLEFTTRELMENYQKQKDRIAALPGETTALSGFVESNGQLVGEAANRLVKFRGGLEGFGPWLDQLHTQADTTRGLAGSVVKEIQTLKEHALRINLLATNALAEAKGGEGGGGGRFAVYSEEMKNLSRESVGLLENSAGVLEKCLEELQGRFIDTGEKRAQAKRIIDMVQSINTLVKKAHTGFQGQDQRVLQVGKIVSGVGESLSLEVTTLEDNLAMAERIVSRAEKVLDETEKIWDLVLAEQDQGY
ncbi:MAG: hypothetical protein HQL52_17410 [Magnetococcales bacterium]|nr:hypothetical protein [Magnetococcales bacterium]